MQLPAGARVGPYEVTAKIGEGGMGEVYRARDTKLGRDVALKLLPQVFASDPDRLARFEREARALAALNHPNIAHIHGLEDSGTVRALVMELVPGRTLEDLLQAGGAGADGARALPIGEALAIAAQIAGALEAAHEHGIIHRDLKPANIKVTDDGVVKVLDFGLAKAMRDDDDQADAALATRTSPVLTQAGLILGTAAYMSPEQARGKPVDRRADIWAFGVVLFEMLSGRRLFDGETVSDVVAAVLTRPIDVAALPADVPAGVRALVARCLERDPRRRLRDIGEARVALESPADSGMSMASISGVLPAPMAPTAARPRAAIVPWAIAGVATIVAAGLFMQRTGPRSDVPGAADRVVAELAPPPDTDFVVGSNAAGILLSPDGSSAVFLVHDGTARRLYVRSLDTGDTRPLSGTEGASYPFWSPDSRSIGFFGSSKMYTLRLAGGLPEAIADIEQGRGGAWLDTGVILFVPRGGGTIHKVSERGGAVDQLTTLDAGRGENAHYWPVALPGGQRFLYFVRSTRPENNGIYLRSIDGATPAVRLVTSLSSGLYAPPATATGTGHLLWVRDAELLAQTIDVEQARLTGDVMTVASDVRVEESQRLTLATVSTNGRLAWASARAGDFTFGWYGRDGRKLGDLPIAPGKIMQPRFSPDDTRFAFTRASKGTADVWLYDIAAGAVAQLTSDAGYDESAHWSPDGRAIVHEGDNGSVGGVVISKVDGSARTPVLPGVVPMVSSGPYMPDGRGVLVTQVATEARLGIVPVDRVDQVTWIASDRGFLIQPSPSPDGKWMAFVNDRAGRSDVYVSRLGQENGTPRLADHRVPVSTGGGTDPTWRKDGRELLYLAPDGTIMAVPVTASGDGIAFGTPTPLLRVQADAGGWGANWAATSMHDKFVLVEAPHAAQQTFRLITNWRR